MKKTFVSDLTEMPLSDFSHLGFRRAFERYFAELEVAVDDWEAVYREMAASGAQALLLRSPDTDVAAFLLYAPLPFSSSFFEGSAAFIQEFWVAPSLRGQGLGRRLLRSAEKQFAAQGLDLVLLTSDTAETFYLHCGYRLAAGIRAKNDCPVFLRCLPE